MLEREEGFFEDNAPELHAMMAQINKGRNEQMLALAQHGSLRLIRMIGEGHAAAHVRTESRLHVATDYSLVLRKEAIERAKQATAAWIEMPQAMAEEQIAHAEKVPHPCPLDVQQKNH